jgi:hypothetical protein
VKLARLALLAYGAMFLYFGLLLFFKPEAFSDTIPVELTDPVARAEIRAFYGGMEIGLAAFLLCSVFRRSFVRPALWFLLLISAGLALGRVVGMAVDHASGTFIYLALAVESAGVVLSGLSLKLTADVNRGIS